MNTIKFLKQLKDKIYSDKYAELIIALYIGMWIMIAGMSVALIASMRG